MDSNNILSIIAIVVSVGGTILAVINHKRLRSNCFGKKLEVSFDVESTTPPKKENNDVNDLKINIPKRPTGVGLPPSPISI
jgi:hypothetical protein